VRGDSLRDLYAKTLAVLGLGLLAGAGAIVDYWPVNGTLPALPVAVGFRPEAPVLAQDLQREIPEPALLRASIRSSFVQTPVRFADALRAAQFIAPEPVVDTRLDPLPIPDWTSISIQPELPESALVVALDLAPPPQALETGEPPEPRGFLAGAIQKARASLKDARSFLGEKLTGVMGAFRKVSPFFSTTAVLPNPA
jgi:hypothetical protein